jgi:hypothetical protein
MLPPAIGIMPISIPVRVRQNRLRWQTRNEEDGTEVIIHQDDNETTRLTGGDDNDGRDRYRYGASLIDEQDNDSNDDNEGNSTNDTNDDGSLLPQGTAPNRDEDSITALTRRLRCMFTVITWPIVPLSVLVVLSFFYMVYGAVMDWQASCSHPLHAYTAVSILMICYAPMHPLARAYLFGYHTNVDGPSRPLAVRRYDQIVHTLALLYVYAGITLDATCREDLTNATTTPLATATVSMISKMNSNDTSMIPLALDGGAQELLLDSSNSVNSCLATCPNLYPAVAGYVFTLEVLCWSLLLPLLCLPCIYLWFLRRASTQAHSFAEFHERLRDDEDVRRNGNILAETVMAQLQDVQLVRVHDDAEKDGVLIFPFQSGVVVSDYNSILSQGKDSNSVKECCICMSDFLIQENNGADGTTCVDIDVDIETGATSTTTNPALPQSPGSVSVLPETDDAIVQTKKCGHLFHKRCIASWIGGQWQGATHDGDDAARRARRTTCPLCRNDLRLGG